MVASTNMFLYQFCICQHSGRFRVNLSLTCLWEQRSGYGRAVEQGQALAAAMGLQTRNGKQL